MSIGKWLGSAATAALLVLASSGPTPVRADTAERYPFDPVCPWGRVADGHGMMIRCLTPKEASWMLQGKQPPASEKKPAEAPTTEPPVSQTVEVQAVGPTRADTGELPLADKKLGQPRERYVDCVRKHGGLTAKEGKVVVRFLVRERGRAEGVGVKSHSGMSTKAARCIAGVVDRRYVGYPAAPIVGATIPIVLGSGH